MFNILKNVIRNGGMPLAQVNERIETMYLSGRISGKERQELTELMHEKADPSNETGDWKSMYEALALRYNDLMARMEAVEAKLGTREEEGDEPAGIQKWELWDGVSDRYQHGAVVSHGGKTWESMYAGQNVWEPGAPGIDERYWREVVE